MSKPKVIVIGAGVIGASVAHHLAAEGAQVVVIERLRPGGGTSAATLGWVNAVDKAPEPYFRLAEAAVAEHRVLEATLGRTWQHGRGALDWAGDRAGRDQLERNVEQLHAWGHGAQVLATEDIPHMAEPRLTLDPASVPWVVRYPEDRWAHPAVMIAAMLDAARASGAHVRIGVEVVAVELRGDRVVGVRSTDGERIPADVVIDCAGPGADHVAAMMGVAIPLEQRRGLILVTQPAATALRGVVRSPGLWLRSDGGGRIMLSAAFAETELPEGMVPQPDHLVCQDALRRARLLLAGLDGVDIEVARVGHRPYPADGHPIVGPVPGLDGGYIVVTHSGVTLAPLLGRLVAEEVVGYRPAAELEPFRPGRFRGP